MEDYFMKSKIAGIVFLIGGLYYLIAEVISALAYNDTLLNTYLTYTISELGVPSLNSPLSFLMNSAFILIGLIFIFCNFYRFKDYIIKNRVLFYILTLVCSLGVIIVGFIHADNPISLTYHSFGAIMAILGGNLLLVLVSRSMSEFGIYQKISLVLGCIGIIAFWVMFFNMETSIMPLFERIAVYALIIWILMTGGYLLKNPNPVSVD